MTHIKVMQKSIYGRPIFHPLCEHSRFLCDFIEQKTLTLQNLRFLKARGYEIEVVKEDVEI